MHASFHASVPEQETPQVRGAVFRPALVIVLLMTILTGIIYPIAVTGVAKIAFPRSANGSLLQYHGRTVGSQWIGQSFTDPSLFWGRPSAVNFNAAGSGGSNFSVLNPDQEKLIHERAAALRKAGNLGPEVPVPVDLVTASASGLDPHISPAAAKFQIPRVAAARGLDPDRLRLLVLSRVEGRTLGLLGEPRINVLMLNLDLMALSPSH